ncbi:MAG TPA: site-2 protease family protein [Rhodocyclaceae bacterium]|nr:site-2 protease family protein [Rhodocyclaceae bacterium]
MTKLLFLLLGGLKFGKLLTTGGTMLLSVFAYALFYGWQYAAGFVALMFVHEMGHYLAARQRGLDVGAPTFIPFVGAWIQMKEMPHDAETEAYVGLGGPFIGTLGAFACYFAGRYFDSMLLVAISYSGFFLNLFNLIPVSPLDGGRITAVLTPRIWLLGVPVLIGVFFWHPSPMLILIAILAAPQIMKALKYDPNAPENAYYDVSAEDRVTYAAYYLILVGVLAGMSYSVHDMLQTAHMQ